LTPAIESNWAINRQPCTWIAAHAILCCQSRISLAALARNHLDRTTELILGEEA
jgi:hypothetical protein